MCPSDSRHRWHRELTQWYPLNHLNTLPEAGYSYDFFKATLLRHRIPLVDYQFHDSFFLHVVASLAAGTCGTSSLPSTRVFCAHSVLQLFAHLSTS